MTQNNSDFINTIRLKSSFFNQDVLTVARCLMGKVLVLRYDDGSIERFVISETEAYRGEEDEACHAFKGRTKRTEVMHHDGGLVYVYLIYGMYWMLNFVTGTADEPQAVLIRGVREINGPGRLGRYLKLDKSFYGEKLNESQRIWVEENSDSDFQAEIETSARIGIDYASEEWRDKKWRFILKD
ncbi:MAG: DNA-3-methyladenine glycosylase [Carboxylicivirga sp.]|nr:DNA-3-methyladenine glycosylase [Carboxylicivirga sp.]